MFILQQPSVEMTASEIGETLFYGACQESDIIGTPAEIAEAVGYAEAQLAYEIGEQMRISPQPKVAKSTFIYIVNFALKAKAQMHFESQGSVITSPGNKFYIWVKGQTTGEWMNVGFVKASIARHFARFHDVRIMGQKEGREWRCDFDCSGDMDIPF